MENIAQRLVEINYGECLLVLFFLVGSQLSCAVDRKKQGIASGFRLSELDIGPGLSKMQMKLPDGFKSSTPAERDTFLMLLGFEA